MSNFEEPSGNFNLSETENRNKPKILIVEDEALIAHDLEISLIRLGYAVTGVSASGKKALESIAENRPDIVLMDITLKGKLSGIEIAHKIKSAWNIPVIFTTSSEDDKTVRRATASEPAAYLLKPIDIRDLRAAIEIALIKSKVENDLRKAKEKAEHLNNIVPSAVVTVDTAYRVTGWNRQAAVITGYEADEIMGRTCNIFCNESCGNGCSLFDPKIKKPVFKEECSIRRKNGELIIISKNSDLVTDHTGEIIGGIESFEDITIQKAAENQLKNAHDILEKRIIERTTELEKRNKELHFLNKLIGQVTNSFSFTKVMHTAVEGINSIVQSDLILFFRYEEGRMLPMEIPSSIGGSLCRKGTEHKAGECLCGLAAAEGKPQYSLNIHEDTRCTREECKKAGYHSFAAIPLLNRGDIIGVVGVASFKSRDFREHATIIESFCDGIAVGLQNAMLYDELKRHEKRFRIAAQSASDLIFEWDMIADRLLWFGDNAKKLGLASPVTFADLSRLLHPEDRYKFDRKIKYRQKTGGIELVEFRIHIADEYRFWEKRSRTLFDDNGNPVKQIGVCTDVTEKKVAEKALRASEHKFRELFENMHTQVVVYEARENGLDFIIKDINASGERSTEVRRENVIGRSVLDVFPGIRQFGLFEIFQRVWRTGKPERLAEKHYRDDRISKWFTNYVYKLRTGEIVAVFYDLTNRRMAEEKLRKNRYLLQLVFDGISDPLILVGDKMKTLMLNKAAKSYYGGKGKSASSISCCDSLQGISGPCERCRMADSLNINEATTFERHNCNDPERHEQVSIYPVGDKTIGARAIIRITDITQSVHNQRLLARADRLASLGQLSGGIAHEIRNPLGGIKLFLDILSDESRYSRSETEQDIFNDININIDRIEGIIKRVLDFSKPGEIEVKRLDINEVIEESVKLLDNKLKKSNIALKLSLNRALSHLDGDFIALQQLITNVMINAAQAMDNGGLLSIKTDMTKHTYRKNSRMVRVTIEDTGMGIPPEEEASIFNPFFTTKSSGTGLGLSISHQIVERHSGFISFESRADKGTRFIIDLPAGKEG